MTLQSQTQFTSFDIDFGRCQTHKAPPLVRYPPWVNPYHPLPGEDAYAAAMMEDAKAMPTFRQNTKHKNEKPSSRYLEALIEHGPATAAELAVVLGVTANTVGGALKKLGERGLAARNETNNRNIPFTWWATEAAK